MSRLPIPGSDNSTWGDVLNDFLSQEHAPDGSQKPLPQSKIINLTSDLAGKVNTSTTINGRPLSSNVTLAMSDFGLGSVDNTTDANKPISTAQQAGFDADRARLTAIETGTVVANAPTGIAVTDGAHLQALINAHPSGVIHLRPGTYQIDTSLDVRNKSNLTICGAGIDSTVIACTAALNGSDNTTKNAVFNANNYSVTDTPPYPYRGLAFCDMTIDCSLQNAGGVPVGAVFGYNLCAIECQNVDSARFSRLRIVNAFGNAIVSASIRPSVPYAVEGAVIKDCIFEGCVRGVLPQYLITGSVIQYGAMRGGEITGCNFINSGGPAIDMFNCAGSRVHHNYLRGVAGSSIGANQTMNSIRSDFGLVDCTIDHNVLEAAGVIQLNGIMTPNTLNENIPTPGPQDCTIDHNVITSTGTTVIATPAIPASTGTQTNTFGAPVLITVSGGSGVNLLVDNVVQNGSGASGQQYMALAGSVVRLDYTSAPTWTWLRAPNAGLAAITLLAGNAAGQSLGMCESNHVAYNTITLTPCSAIQLYDAEHCDVSHNIIRDIAEWNGGYPAIQAMDSNVVSGGGSKECSFTNNIIADTRGTPRMGASFQNDTANNVNNSFLSNRIPAGVIGLESPVSRLQYIWEDNYAGALLVRSAVPSVASAGTLSLPDIGATMFVVTGTTSITGIFANTPGRVVILKFAAALSIFDTGNLLLANIMTTTADDTLTLVCDGTNWIEIARSIN